MRSLDSGVQTSLDALEQPGVRALINIPGLGLRWTTHARTHTHEGLTYTAPVYANEQTGFGVSGISETTLGEIPAAQLTITGLDGARHANFWADQFRGRNVEITGILVTAIDSTGGVVYPTTTWRMDVDGFDESTISVRLSVPDANQRIPHKTTQQSHCEHTYGPDARRQGIPSDCFYRGSKTTCDFTLDGPNGCTSHFPDIDSNGDPWTDSSTGIRHVVPLPFGGSPSGLEDRLVT